MRSYILPFKNPCAATLYLLLFFTSQNIFAQPGWFNLTPTPSRGMYNGVQMFSNGTGYGYCDDGSVVKTTDKGASWFFLPDEYNFKRVLAISGASKVSFINSQTGFLNNSGRIFKTTDGGNLWLQKGISPLINTSLFEFTDELTGYSSDGLGTITKTTNGGSNWFAINTPSTIQYHGTFKFINNTTGICTADNKHIYRTSNGGISWQVTDSTNTIQLRDINVVNPNLIYIGTFSGIYKSTNAGVNWSYFNPGYLYRDIRFVNEFTGYMAFGGGGFKKTTNGGTNWFDLPSSFLRALQGCTMDSSGFGVAFGWSGQIASTSDGGQTWQNSTKFLTGEVLDIKFLNTLTGYVITSDRNILKTTDGGLNFRASSFTRSLSSVFIKNEEEIIVGGDSIILRTSNGGVNWTQYFVNAHLDWFTFPNALTGFGIHSYYLYPTGSASVDVKTTDGGLTWQLTGTNANSRIHFFDSNNGIYSDIRKIGTNGPYYSILYRTTNTGLTWNKFDSLYAADLDGFSFINNQTGYSSSDGKCFKTTNQGNNWMLISNFDARGCQFANELTGYAYMSKTTNGGVNWFTQNRFALGLCVLDANTVYGFWPSYPVIIKTTNGGVDIVEIENISTEIPGNFYLKQNYPNPFNPTTKINFDLKNSGIVQLKIFDIIGREVSILVNEKLSVGSYSYDFDGSNLPSGVYFYQLQTDGFIETKKMILLK